MLHIDADFADSLNPDSDRSAGIIDADVNASAKEITAPLGMRLKANIGARGCDSDRVGDES